MDRLLRPRNAVSASRPSREPPSLLCESYSLASTVKNRTALIYRLQQHIDGKHSDKKDKKFADFFPGYVAA
jgi:hypothetical protein